MTALAPDPTSRPKRMCARATVRTERVQNGPGPSRTRLARLRSQAPLRLRPTLPRATDPWPERTDDIVRVCLAAAAAGPMGGDDLALEVKVGAGTTLVLTEATATLLLPGGDGARSRLTVRADVADGATFVWLPEPVIAARDCHHVNDISVELAADARLLMREEILLGRHGETCGRLHQKTRIHRDGRPLHVQELRLGEDSSRTPAVVGSHRAVGSLIVVDPSFPALAPAMLPEDGALLPLAGCQAVLAQALSADSIGLRRQLDAGLTLLGPPWSQSNPNTRAPFQEAT